MSTSKTYRDLGGGIPNDENPDGECSWRCDGRGYDRYGTINGRKVPVSCRPAHRAVEHTPRRGLRLVRS